MTVSSCEPSAPIILVLRFDGTGYTTIGVKNNPHPFGGYCMVRWNLCGKPYVHYPEPSFYRRFNHIH